jgi:hypothetical protein
MTVEVSLSVTSSVADAGFSGDFILATALGPYRARPRRSLPLGCSAA